MVMALGRCATAVQLSHGADYKSPRIHAHPFPLPLSLAYLQSLFFFPPRLFVRHLPLQQRNANQLIHILAFPFVIRPQARPCY